MGCGYPRPVPQQFPPSSLPLKIPSRSRRSSSSPKSPQSSPSRKPPKRGRHLLEFDRRFGRRFAAGVDEAGRGSLAGPLVVAGVLFDYELLRNHRCRPLAGLNDSKQLTGEEREALFHGVVACAKSFTVRVVSSSEIDRNGLHRSNLEGMRSCLRELAAPAHTAVVDGDERSAAIAAASIIAKVVRDRAMRRMDALFPAYGFSSHVGYITPRHSAVVRERGPSSIHRRSFQALCYLSPEELAARLEEE